MNKSVAFMVAICMSCVLAACGGGDSGSDAATTGSNGSGSASGAGSSGSSGPTTQQQYVSWNGSGNGSVVKDYNNNNFQVRASDRVVVDSTGAPLSGLTVQGNVVYSGNSPYGHVTLVASTTPSVQVTVFQCNDSSGMKINTNAATKTYTTTCLGDSTTATSGTTSAGGGGGGTTAPAPSTDTYHTFSGSANGDVVMDAKNQPFKVRESDGQVVYASNNYLLNGVRISGSSVVIGGGTVGKLAFVNASSGGQIAAFICNNGSGLYFTLSGNTYEWSCTRNDNGTTTSGSQNSGSTGGGGNAVNTTANYAANECVGMYDNGDGTFSFQNTCSSAINLAFAINGLSGGTPVTLYAGRKTFQTFNSTDQRNWMACTVPSIPVSAYGGCNAP
ncbi:hypothetical protein DIE06_27855 [Burkholderia sp. Bp8998]|nr:hypothetical protein DIE06_27855 [Burkholderia sp. Bp8998]